MQHKYQYWKKKLKRYTSRAQTHPLCELTNLCKLRYIPPTHMLHGSRPNWRGSVVNYFWTLLNQSKKQIDTSKAFKNSWEHTLDVQNCSRQCLTVATCAQYLLRNATFQLVFPRLHDSWSPLGMFSVACIHHSKCKFAEIENLKVAEN